jgi:hypothetical protein
MIALIVGDEAVLLGYGLALRLPDAEIREGPGDKDDGRPGTLFAVGELNAVHPQVPHGGASSAHPSQARPLLRTTPPFRHVHIVPVFAVKVCPSLVTSRVPAVVPQTISLSIVIVGVEAPG